MQKKRFVLLAPLVICGCGASEDPLIKDDSSKLALAAALAGVCPIAAPDDHGARDACADALAELTSLRDVLSDPLLWGGQPAGMPLDRVLEDASLTELSPFVWRRMYLSTFMFSGGEATVEAAGKYRVLRVPVQFRNMLAAGDYPYPFWHSEKKWRSYESTIEVLLFFEGDKLVGGTRSARTDPSRAHFSRVWDGAWTWDDGAEPQNTLYASLFSPMNPHVERLERAYRSLEDSMRAQNCTSCHDPANSSNMRQLEILTYPNQALTGRHDVVAQIEANAMPPGVGIAELVVRLDLVRLAREFAEAGDEALRFEGEPVQD